jgi:hypothetical protein
VYELENHKGRDHLGHLDVDGRITVKFIPKIVVNWTELA